jgi:hypothetical protein
MGTITAECEQKSRGFAISARNCLRSSPYTAMTNQTVSAAASTGSRAPVTGAAVLVENPNDTTWFIPPIVVPILIVLLIAVRVLALS